MLYLSCNDSVNNNKINAIYYNKWRGFRWISSVNYNGFSTPIWSEVTYNPINNRYSYEFWLLHGHINAPSTPYNCEHNIIRKEHGERLSDSVRLIKKFNLRKQFNKCINASLPIYKHIIFLFNMRVVPGRLSNYMRQSPLQKPLFFWLVTCSLPYLQDNAIGPYSESYESCLYPKIIFIKIYFNIILPTAPKSPKWSLRYTLSDYNCECISRIFFMCLPHRSYLSWFFHPNRVLVKNRTHKASH